MKNFFAITILVLSLVKANAQIKLNNVEYLDKDWLATSDIKRAVYYRSVIEQHGKYLVKDYYLSNDSLQMEAECSGVSPKIVLDGNAVFYYKNGALQKTGMFKAHVATGLHKDYYRNGNPRSIMLHLDKTTLVCQFWSEDSKPMLINGTGFYVDRSTPSPLFMEVKDSIQIAGYAIENNQDTVYMFTENPATYRGGYEAFYRGVSTSIVYPKYARRHGIEGKVFVQFTVGKRGMAEGATVLKGIGGGCDEAALEACMKQKNWEPATYKGSPVKMRMVLPITFRLQ